MESPPYRGVKRAVTNCWRAGTTRHCCAPRGLIARSFEMRWTVPVPRPGGQIFPSNSSDESLSNVFDTFGGAAKKWPHRLGPFVSSEQSSRRHFGLDCFSSRRVFGHYLLALGAMITTGLVSGCMMALLHVMRHMRLGLRRLNSLWR